MSTATTPGVSNILNPLKHANSVHERNREYSCEQCYYSSSRKYNLLQHVTAVHEGIKHNCDQCDYRSS